MRRVLDCSVAFKWVVAESDTAKAVRLRDDFRNGVLELLKKLQSQFPFILPLVSLP